MAKKSPEQEPKPQHDEYVERFEALAEVMTPENRDEIVPQVDRVLDKHAVDYPEIVIGYQLGRLAVEVEEMLV